VRWWCGGLLGVACTAGDGPTDVVAGCDAVGVVCVVAGRVGERGLGDDDLAPTDTRLALPQDVTVGPDGRWWIADANNHVVREVVDGVARILAGTGSPSGVGALNQPTSVSLDPDDPDVLWLSALTGNQVGWLSRTTGVVTWSVGSGELGHAGDGGPAAAARLWRPSAVARDAAGALWVSDRMNQVLRRVAADGVITTVAGHPGVPGYAGDGGPAVDAYVSSPPGSEFDPGSRFVLDGDRLVLADTGNHAVRVIALDVAAGTLGDIDTLAGGLGRGAEDDPDGEGTARFDAPHDVAVADDGTVFVADTGGGCVRQIGPDARVTTLAGRCGEPGDAVAVVDAVDARFLVPGGVDVHGDFVWVADTGNDVIRRVRWR